MKIDQIAFGCRGEKEFQEATIRASAVDQVTFGGKLRHEGATYAFNQAIGYLAFNYDMGIEIEHLWYPDPHRTFHALIPFAERIANNYFLSHLGTHVENIDNALHDIGASFNDPKQQQIVMDVQTIAHTNKKIKDRKYRYVIIDQRETHGHFLKLIQRIVK